MPTVRRLDIGKTGAPTTGEHLKVQKSSTNSMKENISLSQPHKTYRPSQRTVSLGTIRLPVSVTEVGGQSLTFIVDINIKKGVHGGSVIHLGHHKAGYAITTASEVIRVKALLQTWSS